MTTHSHPTATSLAKLLQKISPNRTWHFDGRVHAVLPLVDSLKPAESDALKAISQARSFDIRRIDYPRNTRHRLSLYAGPHKTHSMSFWYDPKEIGVFAGIAQVPIMYENQAGILTFTGYLRPSDTIYKPSR